MPDTTDAPVKDQNIVVPKWFLGIASLVIAGTIPWAYRIDNTLTRIEVRLEFYEKVEKRVAANEIRIAELERRWGELGGPKDPMYDQVKKIESVLSDHERNKH
jgi:hypothetical protein